MIGHKKGCAKVLINTSIFYFINMEELSRYLSKLIEILNKEGNAISVFVILIKWMLTPLAFVVPQQNLWVALGVGRSPSA